MFLAYWMHLARMLSAPAGSAPSFPCTPRSLSASIWGQLCHRVTVAWAQTAGKLLSCEEELQEASRAGWPWVTVLWYPQWHYRDSCASCLTKLGPASPLHACLVVTDGVQPWQPNQNQIQLLRSPTLLLLAFKHCWKETNQCPIW